jgi:hypothetical protein
VRQDDISIKLKEAAISSQKREIKDLEQQLLITKLDVAQSKVQLDVWLKYINVNRNMNTSKLSTRGSSSKRGRRRSRIKSLKALP